MERVSPSALSVGGGVAPGLSLPNHNPPSESGDTLRRRMPQRTDEPEAERVILKARGGRNFRFLEDLQQ